jgi:hypothetical protein
MGREPDSIPRSCSDRCHAEAYQRRSPRSERLATLPHLDAVVRTSSPRSHARREAHGPPRGHPQDRRLAGGKRPRPHPVAGSDPCRSPHRGKPVARRSSAIPGQAMWRLAAGVPRLVWCALIAGPGSPCCVAWSAAEQQARARTHRTSGAATRTGSANCCPSALGARSVSSATGRPSRPRRHDDPRAVLRVALSEPPGRRQIRLRWPRFLGCKERRKARRVAGLLLRLVLFQGVTTVISDAELLDG